MVRLQYDEISIYTISFPNAPNPNAHFCPVLSFIEIPPKNPLYLNTSIAECHVKYNIYDFLPCPNSALISVQQLLISLPQ